MKAVIILTALAFCLGGNAQNTKDYKAEDYKNVVKNSSFIFEGEVIKAKKIYGRDSAIYTSNIIKISNVFRGQERIHTGTIEITNVGVYHKRPKGEGYYADLNARQQNYPLGFKGVFFCVPLDNFPSLNVATDNSIKVKPYCPFDPKCVISFTNLAISFAEVSKKNTS